MGILKTKVTIDSVTIKDDSRSENLLINWEYERSGTNEISELVINVLKSTNDTVTLTVGKTIQIWKGFTTSTDTKIFDGFISEELYH